MEKEHSYRSRSIQKKLMAATSMLLVATIMLVSSTYAWFTLSTAPEVTGITTTVGANGSLEIALADSTTWSSPDTLVSSAVGSSSAATTLDKANITWGNLVDLSLESYGLDKITLLPSRANITAGVLGDVPLLTPVYGADGRVSELDDNTLFGMYDGNKFVPDATDANGVTKYGVRAIGTSSGMSERQLAYRNARNAVSSLMTDAKTATRTALNTNGNKLADIIIDKALNDSTTVSKTRVEALGNLLDGIEASMACIYEAFDQALLAQLASADMQDELPDVAFAVVSAYIGDTIHAVDAENGQITVEKEVDGQTYEATVKLDAYLVKAIAMYEITKNTLKDAKDLYDALIATPQDSYQWSDVSAVMTPLVNYNNVLVNNMPVDEIKADTNAFIQNYKGTIVVEMPSGSGLFANISDIAGIYTASITVEEVSAMGQTLTNIPASMTTSFASTDSNADVGVTDANDKAYLSKELIAIDSMGAPTAGEGTGNAGLTDTFGYMLDFYFRTNAASSNLMLQTEAMNRVYSNADAASATQGGGSYMEFTASAAAAAAGYTVNSMQTLMSAIRVVFVDDTNNVLANARLDMSEATVTEATSVVKAPLKLYSLDDNISSDDDTSSEETGSGSEGETDTPATVEETGTQENTGSAENGDTTDDSTSNDTSNDSTSGTTSNIVFKNADAAIIASLTQNTAKKVTVLVYLDGDYVTNMDVANAATSMTGKLNLQFSSSVELVPMENAALRDMKTETTTETTEESQESQESQPTS